MYGEVFVYFCCYETFLNHIVGHQLETLHLSFQLRHLSDKHHHRAFVFHLQKICNIRKSDWLFLFQHHNYTWDRSLKLQQNLYSLRWLNCSPSLVSNLTSTGSYIENNDLWFKEKMFFTIDLNCLTNSASQWCCLICSIPF